MKVLEVMTRDVVTLAQDMTLSQAAERLVERGISGAPVVDDQGRLVGILSESDILRHLKALAEDDLGSRYLTERAHSLALLAFLGEERHDAADRVYRRLRAARVADAMTRKVVTVKPIDSLESVAALMIRHDVNRVPVVEGGRLVGIITRADFARFLARGAEGGPRL